MLKRVVSRVQRAEMLDEIVVATTAESQDDQVEQYCLESGWNCYRGSETDVLDRYYQAAKKFAADVVVRITSDCPLMDGALIDEVVTSFQQQQKPVDYLSNFLPHRTFPRGVDIEVFSCRALERSWETATETGAREHVTLFMYRHPEQFELAGFLNETDESAYRWTVDTPEDLQLARTIYEYFDRDDFSWKDVLAACQKHPEWLKINQHIEQKVA